MIRTRLRPAKPIGVLCAEGIAHPKDSSSAAAAGWTGRYGAEALRFRRTVPLPSRPCVGVTLGGGGERCLLLGVRSIATVDLHRLPQSSRRTAQLPA